MWDEEYEEDDAVDEWRDEPEYDLNDLHDTVDLIMDTAKRIISENDDVSEVSVELNGVKIGFKRRLQ